MKAMCGSGTIPSAGICAYLLILTAAITEQQQCGVDNLRAFGDRSGGRLPDDRLQAIVPAYTFNCTGRVTEWRACVDPGGGVERYYIQFQVWRPTAVMGCYRRVGYNAPPESNFVGDDVANADQLLQPSGGCVNLPVIETEQIEFQPGDVIGYYADRFNMNGRGNPMNGGVRVVSDQDVVVYHRTSVPLSELQTQYAIPALGPDPSSCGFEFNESDSNLLQMTSPTDGAPIISPNLIAVVTSDILATIQTSSPSLLTSTLLASSGDGVGGFFPSPSPSFSVKDNGGGGGGGGGEGGSESILLVVVAIVLVILIVTIALSTLVIVIVYRRAKRDHSRNLTNPSYDSTVLSTLKESSFGKHSSSLSSAAPYHKGQSVEPRNGGMRETEQELYASPDVPMKSNQAAHGGDHHYYYIDGARTDNGSHSDSTVLYEDPTSPSYVSQVHSTKSVFNSIGTCVPTEEERVVSQGTYEVVDEVHKYSTLKFFEQDQVFWTPASTTSGLYAQLAVKRY